jgi:hypothetical protein
LLVRVSAPAIVAGRSRSRPACAEYRRRVQRRPQGLLVPARRAHGNQSGLGAKHRAQPGLEGRVVVEDQDADHADAPSGRAMVNSTRASRTPGTRRRAPRGPSAR